MEFRVRIPNWQKFLIALVLVVVIVIAIMVDISSVLHIGVLGLFIEISGVLLLSLGLVRTNDDALFIAEHPKHKNHQEVLVRLVTERFMVMVGLFLLVLGMLLQIFGMVF